MTDTRSRTRILIVDDDPALSEMLQIVLRQEGFDTVHCGTGTDAVAAMRDSRPDLVMLTAKSDTSDVVAGLEAGADDYVAKPFKPKELIARIRTRLRQMSADPGKDVLGVGDLIISVSAHTVKRGDVSLQLTPLEFDLLLALAKRPTHVFSREALLDEVWGYRNAADTRLVNVHVQRLRAKVEKDPEHPEIVVTVRGVGYRAGEPAEAS